MLDKNPTYPAPWGRALRIVSTLVSLICLGLVFLNWAALPGVPPGPVTLLLSLLPLALVLACVPFLIRGYSLTPHTLIIHRLFWETRIPLRGLQSATIKPLAMRGSLRLMGNGGLFSFTGYYRNRTLGTYRAFVTDLHRTVILRFADRTLLVSPDCPEAFIQDLPLP